MTFSRVLAFALAFAAFVSVIACDRTPAVPDSKAIEAVLDRREAAMEKGDLGTYYLLLSPNYADGAGGLDDAKRVIRDTLSSFTSLDITINERQVKVDGERAEATQRYFILAADKDGQIQLNGQERLRFAKENGAWRIVGGLVE
ncbi:MAG: hypothetical protein C4523_21435 [Myxococcales bacterium]|nr:MAG: hypothetical protein C4523_21435 [Myxococcales bacterium]